ncbi:MAG TPA: hypothetical protein VGM50_01235 [Gemmatimonadaceae bacterium]|jgi:hypothetical protein
MVHFVATGFGDWEILAVATAKMRRAHMTDDIDGSHANALTTKQ